MLWSINIQEKMDDYYLLKRLVHENLLQTDEVYAMIILF